MLQFGILGPLGAWVEDQEIELGAAKQRALLAVLLLHAGETVSKDHLVEALWGKQPPQRPLKAIQVYVSQLRKRLGDGVLVTQAPGYVLKLEPGALDLERFEGLFAQGRRLLEEGHAREAGDALRQALSFWRGEPLADFRYETFAANAITRLEELRLIALELRLDADLAIGRDAELIPELERLVREHPLRERLRGLLMLALHRCGRQGDALAVMADARARLREELGRDPGLALQQLEKAMLFQDSALDGSPHTPRPPLPAVPPPSAAATPGRATSPSEVSAATRKTVTVIFCDVVASSTLAGRLDPEALRRVMSGFFDLAAEVIERHGGTVEKFVGDEVVAVFGVPVVREDDALRAVRAAVELRERIPTMVSRFDGDTGLEVRIGVNTGEVVAGDPGAGHAFVTGEPLVIGKRLQQAGEPGEILIGRRTHLLVAHAVVAEPATLDNVKGWTAGLAAFRLQSVDAQATPLPRRDDARLVGRERERQLLAEKFDRVVSERTCSLFTVVGVAGVGKSRLTSEFLSSLGDVTAVRGRCLPYGEGITYRPVIEVVEQLPRVEIDPPAAGALRSLLGSEAPSASADEIGWAFRKLLGAAAAESPLVVVFEDIQWAEERFLELVEQVALLSGDAPILLLCLARPELLDASPRWPVALQLEPLSELEAERLIDELLAGRAIGGDLRDRILSAAGGNPLFVEEMVAMLAETETEGEGDVVVPATIHALLAARLDQLDPAERRVLELAAVEGEVFHCGAVQALIGEDTQILSRLSALVLKQMIRPERAELAGEDGFRFQHLLIRDVAYETILKSTRADLHERFADWLEENGTGLADLDELLGYHLERAHGYLQELGQLSTNADALAERVVVHLAAAGRRAMARLDDAAAVSLLARARALASPESWQLALDVAAALRMTGRVPEADGLLTATVADAASRGDRRAELHARLAELEFAEDAVAHRDVAEHALHVFKRTDDESGLTRAWVAIGAIERSSCRYALSSEAYERALALARRTGNERVAGAVMFQLVSLLVWGPTSVESALQRLEQKDVPREHPLIMSPRAQLEAMRGRFDEARLLHARAAGRWDELVGHEHPGLWGGLFRIEKVSGDDVAAEQALRRACELLEQRGERPYRSTLSGELGRVLCALGRYDEAEECSRLSEELGADDDVNAQMLWRQARARALVHRGEDAQALLFARQALALAEQTDDLNGHGDALMDLAEVLELAGEGRDATTASLRRAQAIYLRKGNIAMAGRAQARLEPELADVDRR